MDLSQDQLEKKASIQKSSVIWGAIVGTIAGLILFWILGGQSPAIRYGGAIVVALIVGFLVFRASFSSGSKNAQCGNCGAAFSISRTGRDEVLNASTPKEEREAQEDGSTKVTTWTEEVYDVTETYTCASCNDVTTKTYQSTRKKDEKEETLPVEKAKKSSKGAKGGKSASSAREKSSRSR